MMGMKIDLVLNWKAPEDKNEWRIIVHPEGIVHVTFFDPITKMQGSMDFAEDADLDFIKGILQRIGFVRKTNE